MEKKNTDFGEIITDERFLSWYFKADPVKSAAWEELLAAHPEWTPLVAEAIEWLKQLPAEKDLSPQQVVEAEKKLIINLLSGEQQAPVISLSSRIRRYWWQIAAVVVLLTISAVVWNKINYKPSVQTAYGEMKEQRLPDGSQVVLNAHTKLSYSPDWEKGAQREVWLKGEAFFHVKKTPNHSRFIVHANQLDIIVTGTQFNVQSRDDRTSVMLTEGSVTLRTSGGRVLKMKPGDFVEFDNNQLQKEEKKSESNVLAWKEHKLVFNNTSMQEVAKTIHDLYGVDVKLVDEETAQKTISGILPNNNLDVFLQALEATMAFDVDKEGDVITIKSHS